jgi:hypothetical protein
MLKCPNVNIRTVGPVRFAGRFYSGLKGRRRIYHTILKLADHALLKIVRYVLLHSGLTIY